MPRRTDIRTVLLIGSGPIIIGQACEFDYSGAQACKALREEGFRVILVNSNPATIMTDPEMADRTYIEPITFAFLEKVIEKERPDALLPTMGGQTALNMAVVLSERGVLEKYGVTLIGASYESINRAENRQAFKTAMVRCNLAVPASAIARSKQEALKAAADIGYPAIIRPSFTLGGTGGSIVYNREEFEDRVIWGLEMSPSHEVLIEQSVLGWKEFELEVMRDRKDNVVIICSIENFDPMGIHTGDSITVAPAQTLTDKEYQRMRDAAIRIIREIGVDTGGSNIQFAVNPETGEMVVIEMNPRVSRSSALASKATGFPIAKMATKLAVGYSLDEIQNDITKATPASFEPTIDYVVVKVPRFAFEKFPQADSTLTTQMKSVGEAMAIGRTFREALQKAIRSLEIDRSGLEPGLVVPGKHALDGIRERLSVASWDRLWTIADAFRYGMSLDDVASATRIDPWFLDQVASIVGFEDDIAKAGRPMTAALLRDAKRLGFSDERIAQLTGAEEGDVEAQRLTLGIEPVFKRVDTCGAEFEARTHYLYSTYESSCEADPTSRRKVMILGGGPNRIGQGIEFDYCCVHAAYALREEGIESIMVNCNPETVSTDYDTSDRLYFEPLTREDVLSIIRREKPEGIVVQFGGQTPLKLAVPLEQAGVKILGTTPDAIDRAEDRERFKALLEKLGLRQPESGFSHAPDEALQVARRIGYPVIVRPSYVLGGRAMEVVYDERSLEEYVTRAVKASHKHPVLIDKYLEDAIEVDVDAVSDGEMVVIGGIMEHIEEAGVHSGDSACSLPAYSLTPDISAELGRQTKLMALELGVVGLMNVQFALKDDVVYVLEVNPRASRTVPFVSKAIGVPLAKLAMKVMVGRTLAGLGYTTEIRPSHMAVKEAVFPFNKFPGVDTILGPEMKSTGEVMGLADDFGSAFAKSQIAAGASLPLGGTAFISVKDRDKPAVVPIARKFVDLGFVVVATQGTAEFLKTRGVPAEPVFKVNEGRPNIVDHMKNDRIRFVINTVGDKVSQRDSYDIRRTALNLGIPYVTTIPGARAAVRGIEAMSRGVADVKSLQAYHGRIIDGGKT